MKTHDSVSGNLKVVIKSATGTTGIDAVPTGPILAVSNLISCSIIPSEGFGLVSFTFNPNFIASGGDITLYLDTTEIIFFGYALFFAVDSHSTHPGNYFGTNDGGANWYTVSDMDSIFYLYEEIEEPQLIELASFDAIASREKVTLQWVTGSEIDNEGFNLYRAESEDGEYVKINPSLIPAEGSPTQGASYKFVDNNTRNRKTYWYKLEDVDIYGNSTVHGPVSALPRLMYGVKR